MKPSKHLLDSLLPIRRLFERAIQESTAREVLFRRIQMNAEERALVIEWMKAEPLKRLIPLGVPQPSCRDCDAPVLPGEDTCYMHKAE
jgi:serine/threonine-protein kinase RIO1